MSAMQLRLSEAAALAGGRLRGDDAEILAVGTDTRALPDGALFVALRGERFDAHDFVAGMADGGVVAAMVDIAWAQQHPEVTLPLLMVDDTRRALGRLARGWRARFSLPLIGVTGSNGKTTVKEMVAAILRAQAVRDGADAALAVLATQGNLNNDIGVPLTLLRLRPAHKLAVIEMGMNHVGEIAWLAELAAPTVALVNNAQREHLEFMQSVAEVARENGSVYAHVQAGGTAVINADDAFADYWRGLNGNRRVLSFGVEHAADVSARVLPHGLGSELELSTPAGSCKVMLRVPGMHNVKNALCAAAATLAAGCALQSVVDGLQGFTGVKGRQQIRDGAGGCVVIDDTYNANPDSVDAAIDVLAMTPGRKILVLGDMGEVGERAGEFHAAVGGRARSAGVDRLYALGEHSALAVHDFGDGARHFASVAALVETLRKELDADTTVLVKGSRFMKMERVSDALCETGGTQEKKTDAA